MRSDPRSSRRYSTEGTSLKGGTPSGNGKSLEQLSSAFIPLPAKTPGVARQSPAPRLRREISKLKGGNESSTHQTLVRGR